MHSYSIIIPAYNEGKRILNVLKVLRPISEIKEIIIVDDGSKDDTSAVIQSYLKDDSRVKFIQHPRNMGKGQSIYTAWEAVTSDFVLMLDADLIGLTPEHVTVLCDPVISGKYDMTLGLFKGGNWKTDFSHWATPWLTGQRCLRREMLQCISREAASGYGLETAMTVAVHQQGWKVKKVPLRGMSHPVSEIHRGGLKGVANRVKMYLHVFRAWYIATAKSRFGSVIKNKLT
jgi:glycosyltransferase involved in cell wall biosynthesis